MPPEPLPWERKEFFKERKHERSKTSSSSSFGGSTPRWRDFSSHYGSSSSREFVEPRWPPPRSNDFRRPPGRGWHMFGEESGHVYAPSRSGGEKMMEDENFRPRGEGRYVRNSNRDSRGSFSQRYWKGHPSWEVNNRGSLNAPGRPLHNVMSNEQRSVDDMLVYPPSSHATHSDFVNTWDPQIQSKDQHDNDSNSNDKMGGVNGLGTDQKVDVENSLEWKPLKWSRTASMSSRGSGYSHSSSSKSLGVDSNEGKAELQPKNLTPVQSPSGDVATCATSAAPSEETTSRKKPRLGWGEGLAKYEKKKVDPDVSLNKDGAGGCSGSAEPSNSQSPSLADKSPGVMGFSDCASPATPSSVACSSSPGVEEKMFGKSVNVDNDVSNLCRSPSVGSQNNLEVFSFNLEKVDNSSIANLGSALVELLQSDDLNSVDSRFVRSTAMNKLLVWKGDISKELEVTESEIDSLENELKSMKCSSRHPYPPPTSFSFPPEAIAKPCSELGTASNNVARPSPLQVVSCRDEIMENISPCDGALVKFHTDVKEDDIDSPGTATSKFVEPLSLVKAVQSSDAVENGECVGSLEVIPSPSLDLGCSDHCSNEDTGVFIRQGVNMLEERKDTPTFSGDVNVYAGEDDNLCDTILASNREYGSRALDVFAKLLPKEQRKIEFSEVVTAMSSQQSDALVKEQLATRKRLLRSNERLLTLKFRAFQHLWKEDMRLLSVRKYRAKSQKKYELSLRTTNSRLQKHRSSIRSRFSSPAGNLSLVPTSEMLNFSTKLLSGSHVKPVRNDLKMPALILDKKERMVSRFISSNGLVEDPCAVEKERAMINPWTSEEREIFLDKLATFGKDFQKIASFLDHKSTADCVEFYYKNHKSDCFEKTKKKQSKASTNYLVASSKKWNREINAASLDILGAASVMAADADNSARSRQLCPSRIVLGGFRDSKAARVSDDSLRRSRNERETVAADVLAGLCGSVSSEAMSSCLTTYADPVEAYQERKCPKNDTVIKQPSPSDVTQCVDEETCSDESCGEMDPADWTDEEKSAFIQAVSSYGKDFDMISRFVKTRSRDQCKVFFSKARKCLGLDLIHPEPANVGTPVSDDANGGGGDTEDACALESGMGIHSDKLGAEVDENIPLLAKGAKHDGSGILKTVDLCKGCISEDNNANATGFSDQKVSRVVEASVSDACRMEHCPDLTSDADRKSLNDFVYQSESAHTWKNSVPSVDQDGNDKVAEVISVAEKTSEFDPGAPNLNPVVEVKAMAEVPTCEIGNELNGRRSLLPENGLSNQSILMQDSIVTTNTSQLPVSTDSCSNFSFDAENMQEVSTELDSVEKPLVVSLPKKRTVPSANTTLHASSMHSEKKQNEDRMSSTVDLQDTRYTKGQKPVNRDDYLQHLSGNMLNHSDCSQILRGYPLQITTNKELNGDVSSRPHSEVRAIGNTEKNVASSQFVVQSYLQKCNSSKALGPVHELPLTFQRREQGSDHPNDLSGGGSDVEKPCRNGNVKLFGKILSNPSSALKSSSYAQDEKGILHHKPSSMLSSSTLRFAGHHHTDGHPVLPKSDHNGYFGLDNVPVRGYSYWEGNGIQSGFTSIPDSARLLAAYPAAFSSSFQATSSKLQHQALQVAVKGNDCTLNGASVFSPSGSNGVVDYQLYRGHDSSNKVPPFTIEMKQREDIFSEMQRLNGQQGRGVVGMNVVGRGGGVVVGGGGPCTPSVSGISDPVAAIKLHYTKTDKYGAQNGTIVREEESWRGNGDIGR